jgi:hypothetical protein
MYYPNGELLDTSFPQACSASWRGIIHGLELLKKEVIWRVGMVQKSISGGATACR